ncbi:MAG TPA: hypothetical protein VKZ94_04455 [Advenella sp.]|nr:hypothetical protein [Advenella sp.]
MPILQARIGSSVTLVDVMILGPRPNFGPKITMIPNPLSRVFTPGLDLECCPMPTMITWANETGILGVMVPVVKCFATKFINVSFRVFSGALPVTRWSSMGLSNIVNGILSTNLIPSPNRVFVFS